MREASSEEWGVLRGIGGWWRGWIARVVLFGDGRVRKACCPVGRRAGHVHHARLAAHAALFSLPHDHGHLQDVTHYFMGKVELIHGFMLAFAYSAPSRLLIRQQVGLVWFTRNSPLLFFFMVSSRLPTVWKLYTSILPYHCNNIYIYSNICSSSSVFLWRS